MSEDQKPEAMDPGKVALSDYLAYDDLEKCIPNLKLLTRILASSNYIKKCSTHSQRREQLTKFIAEAEVETYAHLCCAVEQALPTGTVAFNMRKLLKPERFLWYWFSTDNVRLLLKSSNSHFPTIQACKDDGLKHMEQAAKLAGSDTSVTLSIVACFSNGEDIGTVLEIAAPSIQTEVPKRKRADSESGRPPKKLKIKQKEELDDVIDL